MLLAQTNYNCTFNSTSLQTNFHIKMVSLDIKIDLKNTLTSFLAIFNSDIACNYIIFYFK